MTEKTNQELYDKIIEGFNKVLADTGKINSRTYETFDLMEPTYGNARQIIDMLDNVTSKISNIENKIKSMESLIAQIQKNLR